MKTASKSDSFVKVKNHANLYVRGGIFYARLHIGRKKTFRSLRTTKKKEALDRLLTLRTGRRADIDRRCEPTLHQAVDEAIAFRVQKQGAKRGPSELSEEHQTQLMKVKALYPDNLLSSFTSEDLMEPIANLKRMDTGEPAALTTRKKLFEAVKGAFSRAVKLKQIDENPLADIEAGNPPRRERRNPTREGLDEICQAIEELFGKRPKGGSVASGKGAALTVRFLAWSGMRLREAQAVKWKDIQDGRIKIYGTKTDRSRRSLDISPSLQQVLDDISAVYGSEPEANVMPVKTVLKYLAEACDHLGRPKLIHHDLRSFFVTTCCVAGVPADAVAAWIGDTVETVMRVYLQTNAEQRAQAAAKLV